MSLFFTVGKEVKREVKRGGGGMVRVWVERHSNCIGKRTRRGRDLLSTSPAILFKEGGMDKRAGCLRIRLPFRVLRQLSLPHQCLRERDSYTCVCAFMEAIPKDTKHGRQGIIFIFVNFYIAALVWCPDCLGFRHNSCLVKKKSFKNRQNIFLPSIS